MAEFKHDFQVGDGVHWSFNGDSYPGTVVRVTPNIVEVRPDRYQVKESDKGMKEGHRDCEFFEDPDAPVRKFRYQPSTGRIEQSPFVLHHGRAFGRNPHL